MGAWAAVAPAAGRAQEVSHEAAPPAQAPAVAPAGQPAGRVEVTPAVDDAMLAPPPGAARELRSWQEALDMVRLHAPRYLSAVQRVQAAEARSRIALAGVLPSLTGEGRYTHQFFTEEVTLGARTFDTPLNNLFNASARLRVPVVNMRAIHGLSMGEKAEQAAELSLADERRQIAATIVDTMLATLATARVAELNRTGLRSALERLALATARERFGRGTALDVDRAQQDVAAARAELIQGDEALRTAREALGMVLGSEAAIAVSPALDLGAFERAVAQTCKLSPDLEQRPDIAAARARVELAERMVDDVGYQYWPTLDLVSELAYASEVMINGPNTTWNIQGVLSVPLYDGGARYGLKREQEALAAQARQALTETRLAAVVDKARATRAVAVLSESRDVAREQRDLARAIDERIRQGYAGGLGTSLDLVVSAQSLRQAENRLVLLELEVAKARAGAVLASAECMY